MRSNHQSGWERLVAISLLILLIFLLVLYITLRLTILSDKNVESDVLATLRFLAAICAAFAAFLMPGRIELDIKKIGIRAAGGMALFIVVFFWFFSAISESQEDDQPISYQYITAANSYPTYSAFNRSNPYFPPEIGDSLGIEGKPIINDNNPVFNTFEIFKSESLHPDLSQSLSVEFKEYPGEVEINKGGETIHQNLSADFIELESQSEQEFMKNADRSWVFNGYADVKVPASLQYDDGSYTSILPYLGDCTFYGDVRNPNFTLSDSYNTGTITQKPKAKYIAQNLDAKSLSQNKWINKIIEKNPDSRGLATFTYAYRDSREADFPSLNPHVFVPVEVDFLEPYIRFIDIKNTFPKPIRLESLTLKTLGTPYDLTQIDGLDQSSRRQLFEDSQLQVIGLGVLLREGQHIFIPIEFGLRTPRSYRTDYSDFCLDKIKNKTLELSDKQIEITKPISKELQEDLFSIHPFELEEDDIFIETVSDRITIPREFIEKSIQSQTDLDGRIFAVGPILDVSGIKISGKFYKLDSPLVIASATINPILQEGSCPYLKVLSTKTNSWNYLGNILTNRSSKELSGEDTYNLGSYIRSIRLEERERETSFISYVIIEVRHKNEDKYVEVLKQSFSRNFELNSRVEDSFEILESGEFIEINLPFDEINFNNIENIRLRVNGFYLTQQIS